MRTQRPFFFTALLVVAAAPLACNSLTGVDDLVLAREGTTGGQGAGQPTGSGQGGAASSSSSSSSGETTGTGIPDPPPVAMVEAVGATMNKISLYQGVERKLMEDGVKAASKTPIVAGRGALLRIFFSIDGSYDKSEVTARVTPGEGAAPIEVTRILSGTSKDATLASTINFDLPPEQMVPGLGIRVELLQPSTKSAGNNPAASYPATGFESLGVQSAGKSLKVKLVPITYQADGSNRKPDTSASQIQAYKDAFYGFYPIPEIELLVHAAKGWNQTVSPNGAGWGELLQYIADLRVQDNTPADTYYYGIFSPASSANQYCSQGCVAGLGMLGSAQDSYSRAAIGLGFSGEIATETAVHEVGHNHGRNHAPCGGAQGVDSQYPYQGASIGSWGYDLVSKKLLSPQSTTDMMGYCSPIWVSDYTFTALFKRIKLINNADVFYPPELLDRVYERVRVDAEGNATWLAPLKLPTPPSSEAVSMTVHSAEGSEVIEGQLYRYDHLEGGVLVWPEGPRAINGLDVTLTGKSIHLTR